MEVRAKVTNQRISAQKVRLVANEVRGDKVDVALNKLIFNTKKSAQLVKKVIESAIANAENNFSLDIDALKIHQIFVDEGTTLKRFRARAKGRGARIFKRTSHITVIVSD